MKHYKSFLIKIPIFLVIISIIYILFTMFLIRVSSAQHYSLKNYLITNTIDQNRIIIESGSNSYHGINSTMIENYFNKLTINLGDNGGYPLKHKLYRISKFAHKNDIVILPLEYRYYIGDEPAGIYYDNIFFELHHFYDYLPIVEKIKFIFSIPPASFAKAMSRNFKEKNIFIHNLKNFILFRQQATHDFATDFKNGDRGDFKYIGKVQEAEDTKIPCQDYIFFTMPNQAININPIFKKNLDLIKNIAATKGIKFIFTYPTIVGDKCYSSDHSKNKEHMQLLKDIKKLIENNGFEFIGNYQDSYFERNFIYNTWYHVIPEARDIRTQKLIQILEKSKLAQKLHNRKEIR